MLDVCVATGIYGLDSLIGGFPRGGLIVLAGNPGTGKTIFSAHFLYYGANDFGEKGVYVSFAESRETFFSHMKNFGFEFERLEREGKLRFLDMVTVRETGISGMLEAILNEIKMLEAKRLVIDSFSTMAQAFKEPIDVRVMLHTILGKIVRQAECTVLLVVEVPTDSKRIGLGIEEFVADGVLCLRVEELERRAWRALKILKLRGKELKQREYLFTLKGGFQVLAPFSLQKVREPKPYVAIPDFDNFFSSGIKELDEILGGGYPKGRTVLLEIDSTVRPSA